MEIAHILVIIGLIITVAIAFAGLFANILQRLSKLETCVDGKSLEAIDLKVDIVLDWIKSLNGEISNEQFLKRLEIATQKLPDEDKEKLNLKYSQQ